MLVWLFRCLLLCVPLTSASSPSPPRGPPPLRARTPRHAHAPPHTHTRTQCKVRLANFTAIPGGLPFEVVTSPTPHATICDDKELQQILGGLLADSNSCETAGGGGGTWSGGCRRDLAREAAGRAMVASSLAEERRLERPKKLPKALNARPGRFNLDGSAYRPGE